MQQYICKMKKKLKNTRKLLPFLHLIIGLQHLKNQKTLTKTKLKQQKTPSNNNTGNNAYEKRRTKKNRKLLPFDSQKTFQNTLKTKKNVYKMKSKQQQKYLHTHLCWVTLVIVRESNT